MVLCILPGVRYVVYGGKYLLAEQKSGPGCSAVSKRQVSLYLITAPSNTGGISHIFISLKLGEQRSEEEWNISLMHYLNRLERGWARNDRVAHRHIMVKDWSVAVQPC